MGEVEQIRLSAPSEGKLDTLAFHANDDIERALLRDVEKAWRNLTNYLASARAQ